MTFQVDPQAVRTYAAQLAQASQDAQAASRYVHHHGSFTPHEKGVLGMVIPLHTDFVTKLHSMLTQLEHLTEAAHLALAQLADHYEHADLRAETRTDATYPTVPHPPVRRD